MQMDTIRLFCDVAQQRSISRAAELHRVTQSAASQRVQALEKELEVLLIDRSKRPLELTAAGELYHRGCRRIIDQYERLKRQVRTLDHGHGAAELRGEVAIAAIYSAGIDLLNQVKADFEADHPRASVRISYLQPQLVHDRVLREQCDLGILSYPDRWRDLASIRLRDETMVVVSSARHRLAGRPHIHAAQLDRCDMVGFEPSLPIARRIRRYLREHDASPRIVNQFDNIDTIKTFIAETDALAILPDRTVEREVASGILAVIRLEPTFIRPLGIVYLRQREQGPLVRAFIEFLVQNQPSVRPFSDAAAMTA